MKSSFGSHVVDHIPIELGYHELVGNTAFRTVRTWENVLSNCWQGYMEASYGWKGRSL
jgi:hypothetical protein